MKIIPTSVRKNFKRQSVNSAVALQMSFTDLFDGTSNRPKLFYGLRIENFEHCTFIFIYFIFCTVVSKEIWGGHTVLLNMNIHKKDLIYP